VPITASLVSAAPIAASVIARTPLTECTITTTGAESLVAKVPVKFVDLCPIPVKERKPTRQRAKLPSHLLTSDTHLEYIKTVNDKKISAAVKKLKVAEIPTKSNGKRAVTKTVKKTKKEVRLKSTNSTSLVKGAAKDWICGQCKKKYGDKSDTKCTEDWLSCNSCVRSYHETCAEDNGVIDDDDTFVCKVCIN